MRVHGVERPAGSLRDFAVGRPVPLVDVRLWETESYYATDTGP